MRNRTPNHPSPAAVPEQLMAVLRRISHAVDLHSRWLMQSYGLTGPQLMILWELSRLGESGTSSLAKAVSLSQATVTGILDRLERRGLIERQRSSTDKRRVHVRPTKACEQLLQTAPPMLKKSFIDQFTQLANWEQTMILSSLQRLVDLMETPDMQVAQPMWIDQQQPADERVIPDTAHHPLPGRPRRKQSSRQRAG